MIAGSLGKVQKVSNDTLHCDTTVLLLDVGDTFAGHPISCAGSGYAVVVS